MKARYLMVGVLALLTASLWAAVLLGNPSGRGGSPSLPALNGTPPPAIAPEPAGSPPASQPAGASPGLQAARPHGASTGLEPAEDEAEDEPPSAEGGPSTSTGPTSTTTSGGQSLLPSTPQLPGALPPALPLAVPPHLP